MTELAVRTFETYSPPEFRERVAALVGSTTFRQPLGGRATGGDQIPVAQAVAAALAFARRGEHDIGPDLAVDIATGRAGHYIRVCEWLGRDLARDRGAAARRCRDWHALIAVCAYRAVVLAESVPPPPTGCREKDWGELVLYGIIRLMNEADGCLSEAERRWRRK